MPDQPASNDTTSLEPDLSGQKLGNYQLLRRLGRGGMADVYLAEQLSLRRQVAFKVLKRSLAEDEAYVRRLYNEAHAAASLVHANIVQIYEVGCIEGVHFIAQEYVAGQNLKQWLIRHGTADAGTAIQIMRQVIAALSRASQHGIIHRDIKPENIMLARTGEVKVADFGLARVTAEGGAVGLTQVGITMGTPLYMSPEQVEGKGVDPRSDLYSFGVTCYEMLAGRPPFSGDSPLSVAIQHLRTEPERLEVLRPDLPEGLCRIVHRLLAKAPADRYATPADLLRELRTLRVEGLEHWSGSVEEWDTPELLALSDARSEATLRLHSIMKSQAKNAPRRRRLWRWGLVLTAGAAVGSMAAWWQRPEYLLILHAPAVERQESAMLQYWYALDLNTEEAWLAVERYFPQDDPFNRVYALQAKQRLAELYRDNDQPERAMGLYAELVEQGGEEEPQFAASGFIGQANLLAQQNQREAAGAKVAQALRYIESLPRQSQKTSVLSLLEPRVLPLLDPNLRDKLDTLIPGWQPGSEPGGN